MQFLHLLLALPTALAAATIDRRTDGDTIPDAWIVTFKQDAAVPNALNKAKALTNLTPRRTFDSAAFKGFSFRGRDTNGLLEVLSSIGAVESIQPDRKVYLNAPAVIPTGHAGVTDNDETPKRDAFPVTVLEDGMESVFDHVEERDIEARALYVSQKNAPWGLVRICRRKNVQSATTYTYDSSYQGNTAYAYVIDTGINLSHQEFGGRAISGTNAINSSAPAIDDNGHGTHVSGTIGGATFGVAKKVNLIAVKVLDVNGTGSMSGVLAGIDWTVNDVKTKNRVGKAVVNMSLGSDYYDVLNQAVANAVKAGVFFAVAAGNSNKDASTASPASTPEACTIGASDKTDTRASFSNYGSLVDIYAPGVDITSAWIGSNSAAAIASGTSMASPHAAGVAAFLLGQPSTKTSSTQLCSLLQSYSTKGVIVNTAAGNTTTTNLLNNPWPGQR